jgi:hypothetical protein
MCTSRWLAALAAVCPLLGAAEEVGETAPAAPAVDTPSPTITTMSRTLSSQRALNGHVFIPSRYILSPFSQTLFGMGVVFGFANATGPQFSTSGPDAGQVIGEQDYTYGLLGLGFEFHFKLAEWLSMRFAGAGSVFTGIDGKSVLVVGASGNVGGQAGLTAGMPIGKKARGALTFDVEYTPSIDITVAAGIIQALETNDVSSSDYFNDQNILTFVPGSPPPGRHTVARSHRQFRVRTPREEPRRGHHVAQRGAPRALADFDVRRVQPQLPDGIRRRLQRRPARGRRWFVAHSSVLRRRRLHRPGRPVPRGRGRLPQVHAARYPRGRSGNELARLGRYRHHDRDAVLLVNAIRAAA